MNTDFNTLTTLWEKAKDHLDEGELQDIANLDEHAAFLAGNLAAIVEGIGCMVLADDGPGIKTGNFHSPDDVSTLLFSISSQIDHINGLMFVSGEANYHMGKLKTDQPTKEPSIEQEEALVRQSSDHGATALT